MLTPLRFTPIFKNALWGGSRLRSLFHAPPSDDPTGEVWALSDQGDNQSVVADGPLAGKTLRELLETMPAQILGTASLVAGRFPLLLKFLHVRQPLSVQVHPTDALAAELEGADRTGKTEAWYIIEADPTAKLYCGLQPGVTAEQFRTAIASGQVEPLLFPFGPAKGDSFMVQAGTVHALGGGMLLFEVQQTSNLTYRLFDWGRVDPKSGQPRELHIEKGLACVNFEAGPCRPATPTDEGRARVRMVRLVESEYFWMGKWESRQLFRAGADGQCRMLIGVGGRAMIKHNDIDYPIALGDVWLLPAEVGSVLIAPEGNVEILECGIPN